MSKQNITAYIYDKKGRLLATGHNSYTKTHPRQAHFARLAGEERKTYLHAEIDAICRTTRVRGKPFSLFVERKGRDGYNRLARPCCICMLAIKAVGIQHISYTI